MKKIKYFFQNGLLITLIKSWVFKKIFYNFVAGKKKKHKTFQLNRDTIMVHIKS